MESFYVTLPSNVKNGGTMSHYITELPYTLELSGKWEVALTEMFMPHSWHNIDDSNNVINFYEGSREAGMVPTTPTATNLETNNSWRYKDQEETTTVHTHVNASTNASTRVFTRTLLPVGYYDDIAHIVDAIHNSLSPLAQQNIQISKNFDDTLTIKLQRQARFWVTKEMGDMLGLADPYVSESVRGLHPVDLKNGLYSAVIYTNIILPQIIGNVQAPVLRVVPVDGKPGKLMVHRFNSPSYVTLARNSISNIEITIRTDHGEPIVFHSGKVLCKLHFKPSYA